MKTGYIKLVNVFAWLIWGFAASGMASGGDVAVIKVRPEVVATQSRVALGDLARLESATSEVSERLRVISLGYAPAVGMVREIPRTRIELAINAAGFTEGSYRLDSPDLVLVRRASQMVDPAWVREAVEKAALTDLTAAGATARLVRCDLPESIEAPAGKLEVRASTGSVKDIYSDFTVFIELRQEGVVVRRFNATSRVEAYAPVIVAQRDIAANTRLRSDGYKIEVRRLEQPLNWYLTDPGRTKGMSLRRAVARGDVISLDLLAAEFVIRPGDIVRINAESGGGSAALHLTVQGEARTAGRIGDRIQVRNKQSGVMLQAEVVDEGVVRVRF